MDPKELAFTAANIIDDKKGEDIVVADVSKVADITDFFVIATASNNRQVDSLIDFVEEGLKPLGADPLQIEGREECSWALIDYDPVMVHIFQPAARSFYRLDKLWGDATFYDMVDGELVEREGHRVEESEPSRVATPSPYEDEER